MRKNYWMPDNFFQPHLNRLSHLAHGYVLPYDKKGKKKESLPSGYTKVEMWEWVSRVLSTPSRPHFPVELICCSVRKLRLFICAQSAPELLGVTVDLVEHEEFAKMAGAPEPTSHPLWDLLTASDLVLGGLTG